MDKNALLKFKGYLEYELSRKCYTPEYYAVLKHFMKQTNDLLALK